MDTKVFFHYPTDPEEPPGGPGFLEDADGREWSTLLGYAQARHLRRGEVLYAEGDEDTALYVLTVGTVEVRSTRSAALSLEPPATLGEVAFVDRREALETVTARSDAELLRLSQDAFEALAAREPALGQRIMRDLARKLAHALRSSPGPS